MGLCKDSEYWDRLVRRCMSCEGSCEFPHHKCTEFCAGVSGNFKVADVVQLSVNRVRHLDTDSGDMCMTSPATLWNDPDARTDSAVVTLMTTVSLRCWANEGHFFDQLLKQCMPCAELCGNHPAECAQICKAQPTSRSLTELPRDRAVIPVTITGRSLPGGEHHTVIIYSLLGLCLAALFCTLCTAILVLLCKSRGCKAQAGHNKWGAHQLGPQEQETTDDSHCPSSKDRLMDVVVGERGYGSEEMKNTWPTETCMHCFPELRAQWRFEEEHLPPALCLQATGMAPSTGASTRLQHHQDTLTSENHHSLLHDATVNDSGLGIICSPTQSG